MHLGDTAEPNPITGRYPTIVEREAAVVEYESDPDLRDTEQIPLLEDGGIESFLQREVLPYAEDAWYTPSSVRTGYEVNFNRHFYKPQPMRTLEEIQADIAKVEEESSNALTNIAAAVFR